MSASLCSHTPACPPPHPTHYHPQVDTPEDVAAGVAPGAARAAVRKLLHELGIPPEQLQPPEQRFKFLTRLHYCAADTGACSGGAVQQPRRAAASKGGRGSRPAPVSPLAAPACAYTRALAGTWGPQAEWGEHEMDYILLLRADVALVPNPEEVMVRGARLPACAGPWGASVAGCKERALCIARAVRARRGGGQPGAGRACGCTPARSPTRTPVPPPPPLLPPSPPVPHPCRTRST